jgi:hypothetical protein
LTIDKDMHCIRHSVEEQGCLRINFRKSCHILTCDRDPLCPKTNHVKVCSVVLVHRCGLKVWKVFWCSGGLVRGEFEVVDWIAVVKCSRVSSGALRGSCSEGSRV